MSEWRQTAQEYRGPILGGFCVLLALGTWVLFELARSRELEREHLRWVGSEVHRALSIAYLAENRDQLETLLTRLREVPSPVLFARLERDGKTVAGFGSDYDMAPRTQAPGELSVDGRLVVWARVGEIRVLPRSLGVHGEVLEGSGEPLGYPRPRGPFAGPPGDTRPGLEFLGVLPWGPGAPSRPVLPGETVIVLGLGRGGANGIPPPRRQRGPLVLLLMVTTTSAGILGAWALGIRSRSLEAALERSRTERDHLEEFGLTAAGLAHETKNPLGIILGLAQRVRRHSEAPEEVREMAVQIQDAADRATARLGEFLSYARLEAPQPDWGAGRELATEAVEALRPDFEDKGIALGIEAEDLLVFCDRDKVVQVVINLLLNSLEACRPGARVVVRLARGSEGAGVLEVVDQGAGVPEEIREKVFRPYVTGRSDGHGLGLAIVQRIARGHGWSVCLESSPARGTTVRLSGLEVRSE